VIEYPQRAERAHPLISLSPADLDERLLYGRLRDSLYRDDRFGQAISSIHLLVL
jgi:hypothetical protein